MYKPRYVLEYIQKEPFTKCEQFMGYVCGTYKSQGLNYVCYKKLDELYLDKIKVFKTEKSAQTYRQKLIDDVLYYNTFVEQDIINIKELSEEEFNIIQKAKEEAENTKKKEKKQVIYTGIHKSVLEELKQKYTQQYTDICLSINNKDITLIVKGKLDVLDELLNMLD